MLDVQQIKISDYAYPLEDKQIAKYPLSSRDASQLLVFKDNQIKNGKFNQISRFLPDNACLVFNNTKVIRARLLFKKETGAKIEIFCLEPLNPSDYSLMFQSTKNCKWK
jgi:S-adenosylmethionine:tRNA ribosyltransferase-isomerase